MSVILETTLGDIVIDLFTDERPRACLNFLKLCKIKYYNFCLLHSVQQNFLAQTGDPTGRGTGGESVFRFIYGEQAKFFEAEIKPRIKHKKKGTVSMANNGDNLHGSQFFITLGDDLDYLDGQHTVFGEVVEGFEVLDKINDAICDDEHRPYQDIRINHTVILDDPYDDPNGLVIPDRSPEPTKEQLDSGRIGADEEIDDTKGKTVEQIEEMIEEREVKAGTQILEMVGDIPDADIKPPENVLFVCKLNPVTQDEDLEIIFGRFGPVKSCEVIRDQQTGESLQYAFIEFENVEDCERAYFKMDNVLIDDRRIHVDFSQSVAKVKFQKQGAKPVFPEKDNERKPKFALKGRKDQSNYDLVFDGSDEDVAEKSEAKRRKHIDNNRAEEKTKSKDNRSELGAGGDRHGSRERKRKPDEKERRRDRRASYSSSEEERREKGRREKQERNVSGYQDTSGRKTREEVMGRKEKHDGRNNLSSSSDEERMRRKKQTEDISRSHRHYDAKRSSQTSDRDHKRHRTESDGNRHKDDHRLKHSEGHRSRGVSHDYKHRSSYRR